MKGSMDDLIRNALRDRAAESTAACLDSDTAAALIDGTIPSRARASADAHVADCPRCQALLAAMVRATPPPVDRAWWRRPAIAWLAPLTVAATAFAIWINVPDNTEVASVEPATAGARPVASVPVEPPLAAGAADSLSQPIGGVADARSASEAVRRRETSAASAKNSSPPTTPGALADALDARGRTVAPPAAASAPPPPLPAAEPGTSQQAQSAAPTPGRAVDSNASRDPEQVRPSALAESVAIAPQGSARAIGTLIISSNRTSQWRIGAGGGVQHSDNGGTTWRTQATGVEIPFAAGSSPSPRVCWLVGPSGLVLITTDEGASWRRVPFPVAVDLVSVRATDDQTATIVTSDGRTFITSDQGRNWHR